MRLTAIGIVFTTLLTSANSWAQNYEESQMSGIQVDPALCPGGLGVPPRPLVDEQLEPGDIHVTADQVDLIEEGISHLEGNVEMSKDSQQARAEVVDYDSNKEYVDLQGDVNYWDESVYSLSPTAHLEFDDGTGTLPDAEYRLLSTWARGKADELFLDRGTLTRGKNIDFSTCEPQKRLWDLSSNIWKITAKEMILNHETERGTAKHAVLKIKDIPVFYTPYMSFPLSMNRKSGFLTPTYGSANNGIDLRAPYYWNIAPNMDATITPRILTDSGTMLMGEYRYLFKTGGGNLNVEYLPSDDQFNGQDRSYINFTHKQSFLGRGRADLLYNRVSDTSYFEDFGGTLYQTSIQYLQRHANFSYASTWKNYRWNLYTQIQDFQIVNEALPVTSRPYKRLPRLYLTANSIAKNNKLNFHLKSEAVYYQRGNDPLLNNVEGFRFDLFPSVSYPLRAAYGYFKPELGLRYTQYKLNNNNTFTDKSPNRILPVFSFDSGLYFDKKNAKFLNHTYSQTLEPRVFYLYIPKDNQEDLPLFDTSIYDITSSYSTLFYKDRFSGPDRMGDANQFTLAVTSRFVKHGSALRGSVTVGQAFFLEDREIALRGTRVQTEAYSPIIFEYTLTPIRYLNLSGHYHWDFDNKITRKLSLKAQYRPSSDSVINASYRVVNVPSGIVRRAIVSVEQADVSFRWPFGKNWSAIGRWYYDVPRKRTVELFGGVEYNSCCWAFRAGARRFLATTGGEFQTGIFLQFELKGLAGLGRQAVNSITQQIPGYEGDF